MNEISIFDFLKKTENKKLFIKSSSFYPFLKQLAKKYNEFLEEDNEKEYSLFMIKENSKPDFVVVRFLILVKKHLGKNGLLEIYQSILEEALFLRNFLIKNEIDEQEITDSFIKLLKKQKNPSLLSPGDFKAEDILYSKIEKNTNTENKEKKKDIKEFEVKNSELIIYDDEGKVLKRFPAFLTETDRIIPFITPYEKYKEKYYYFGKNSFGRNIDLSEILPEFDKEIEEILLKLVKKLKGEHNGSNQ